MSVKYPIVAVTGSSGAGSPTVTSAITHVLNRVGANFTIIDGAGFHRYGRVEFQEIVQQAAEEKRYISHFSPQANRLDKLETLLQEYGQNGTGMHRRYVHDADEALQTGCGVGTFTQWESVSPDIDILIYEGLHGCFLSESVDIASYMDLKIGVVPIVNLEWIQKIHRDTRSRGYSQEAVTDTILRRLADYVNYITPQFSRTDINFQRIPMVDMSNPFEAQTPPELHNSKVVIRFTKPEKIPVTFRELLAKIPNSFMSRRNNMVIPGSEFELAMQLILEPLIRALFSRQSKLNSVKGVGD